MRIVHFEIPADDPDRAIAFHLDGEARRQHHFADPEGNTFGVMEFDAAAA